MNVILECQKALADLDHGDINATGIALYRAKRIFCVGNGGGYAHAMHFASDLRKIAKLQAFSFDNMAELTARINDDGWEGIGIDWLAGYGYDPDFDITFTFSCGGRQDGLSQNLPVNHWGIGGQNSKLSVLIPSESTPVIEGCQSVIAHHLVEQLCA